MMIVNFLSKLKEHFWNLALIMLIGVSYFVPVFQGFFVTGSTKLVFNLIPMIFALLLTKGITSNKELFVHLLYSAGFGFFLMVEVTYDPTRIDMLWAMAIPAFSILMARFAGWVTKETD